MDFQDHVEERLRKASLLLGLSPLAKEILKILTMIDCRDELAEEIRKTDPYDRPGVISWKTLAEQVPASQNSLQPLERVVLSLANCTRPFSFASYTCRTSLHWSISCFPRSTTNRFFRFRE
jgi:hypothetical protein